MNLSDIISEATAKARKTVLVVNQLEDRQRGGSALEHLAALYDLALEVGALHDGEFLKHAGQSVFLIFESAQTKAAVAAGVTLLTKAAALNLPCVAAIAHGELVHFETADRGVDYLGAPLERAFALTRAAQAGALVADESLLLATAMSEIAATMNRSAELLLGSRHELSLEGLPDPLTAYELLWSETRFGWRSQGNKPGRDAAEAASVAPIVNQNRWVTGVVSSLGSKFGFIVDRTGTPHYFQTRNLARANDLRRGSRVVFRALPALRGAKELRAEDVFALESEIHGVISKLNPAGWGFVKITCDNELEHNLFTLGISKTLVVGQAVRCLIGVNERGPMGYRLEPLEETDAVVEPLPAPPRQRVRAVEAIAAD